MKTRWATLAAGVLWCGLLVSIRCAEGEEVGRTVLQDRASLNVIGSPRNTALDAERKGTISVEGLIEDFEVNPKGIKALRRDIFKSGYFSAFDVLVDACKQKEIDIKYHFAADMKTHVIDSINGQKNWWYAAHYHGGQRTEEPIHRMDTHPYKDWMRIEVYQVGEERVEAIHSAFRAEVERLKKNGNKIVVPEVRVRTLKQNLTLKDVEVRAHGLRSDMFGPDVATAADIMLSLAERGDISLDFRWIDYIGKTLVQGYYFTRFNDEEAGGRAGFTFHMGERKFLESGGRGFGDNFFHMTSDIRVIVSPEYMYWRWTDLSRRGRF